MTEVNAHSSGCEKRFSFITYRKVPWDICTSKYASCSREENSKHRKESFLLSEIRSKILHEYFSCRKRFKSVNIHMEAEVLTHSSHYQTSKKADSHKTFLKLSIEHLSPNSSLQLKIKVNTVNLSRFKGRKTTYNKPQLLKNSYIFNIKQ